MMRRIGPWLTVLRIGLVQASIGAVIVIMTSTLNRVLVVELGLPAAIPGALVALHFLVQLWLRPRLGFGSDAGGRRTPWIRGGMVLLAASGVAAAASTLLIERVRPLGLAAAALAFMALGAGVSAAGTSLLALLAELVPAERRARAAATVWLMMIAGFIVTTIAVSVALTPFSLGRLVLATAAAGLAAVVVTWAAVQGLEPRRTLHEGAPSSGAGDFRQALSEVWAQPQARAFVCFVFISMLAYSAQDLILEPFAGLVFGLSPAESTRISSLHQGGMLGGMLLAGALAVRIGSLRAWATWGCVASAVAFVGLAISPDANSVPLLRVAILSLGLGNGAFAIGAVGSMMALSVHDGRRSAGVRMGVFGAAQAVAYAIGGFAGAAGSDVAGRLLGAPGRGYAAVFATEAVLFLVAAGLASGSASRVTGREAAAPADAGDALVAALG